MDENTQRLANSIGARVRQERLSLQWTLDQLAEHAGISRRMLVNVEQGAANPSVGTLLRLSDSLGVGLPALVEPPPLKAVKITRRGEGAVLWAGKHGGRGVLLGGTRSPNVIELWDWTLKPGESHDSDAHVTGTEELLQVLEGELTVRVGAETHVLGESDALCFPGDEPHAYENNSNAPLRFTLTVFEPGVGTSHRQLGSDAPAN
ncbi:helix-turn-helix domain-containing protein [Glutamicibacter protophormiae]|uniref:Transcriptional regulator with XRE-family HTH domain n=2 Tax=Glutamicibacter protophormiae TaxID=37930 RepID=A0ABS4XNA6_GLUPR|nr:XRE family transcriptional regulator [Glutamicibacter protophormiae]MBP2397860.1 transcriptional regulator with XRE-family HTH domain [Glutamicibacter protophormiae]